MEDREAVSIVPRSLLFTSLFGRRDEAGWLCVRSGLFEFRFLSLVWFLQEWFERPHEAFLRERFR